MRIVNLLAIAAFAGVAAVAFARDVPQSGPAVDGSPAWVVTHDGNLASRNTAVTCKEDVLRFCTAQSGQALRICLSANKAKVSQMCQDSLNSPGQTAGTDTPARRTANTPSSACPRPSTTRTA